MMTATRAAAAQRAVRSLIAAAVAFGLAIAAALVAPAGATRAGAAATHIGIVVRFADGSSKTACTTSGGTGLAVLKRKFTVVIGQAPPYAGFVFTINKQGSTHPDSSHYWSYWHSTGNGKWTYASSGAGSYTPKAGTVEGWSYVNGSSTATKPPAITYATLCASADPKPKVTATPARSSSAGQVPAPASPTKAAPNRTAASSGTATSGTATSGTASGATASTSAAGRSTTVPVAGGTRSGSKATTSPGPLAGGRSATRAGSTAVPSNAGQSAGVQRARVQGSADPPQQSAAKLPAIGTVLALLVVAAIAVTARIRSRRRTE